MEPVEPLHSDSLANRSSPYPDQMVDHHLETTSTALTVSGDQDTWMSPRDRSPVRTSSPREPSGQDHWNQWSPYTLTLLQLLVRLAGGELPPRLSLVSPKVLSPFCHRWRLGFSGLLSWRHLISSDITDFAQMLFKLN